MAGAHFGAPVIEAGGRLYSISLARAGVVYSVHDDQVVLTLEENDRRRVGKADLVLPEVRGDVVMRAFDRDVDEPGQRAVFAVQLCR